MSFLWNDVIFHYRMRVLIFSTAYFPFVGGAEIAVKEITNRLGDMEFDLLCAKLKPNLPDIEKIGNVTVYRLGWGMTLIDKLLVPFLAAAKANQLNKQNHYDYFWVMMVAYTGGGAYIHNILHGKRRVPIVLTLQEGDSEAHLTYRWAGLIGFSWKMALKRTRKLTAISTYLLDRAKRLGFKGEAYLVPNGVNIEKFYNPVPKSIGEEVTLITTSRLNIKNGISDVIQALKFLPERVKFKVLGTGELERELKQLTRELKLENRVEFLGLVLLDQIPEHLHRANIFVRPSLSEGMGNSFIEAMAAGLPVVATPVGGIVDFLKDGETGVFCKPHDPPSIAAAVERILANPGFANILRENALKIVKKRYDWNLIAEEMKTLVFDKV